MSSQTVKTFVPTILTCAIIIVSCSDDKAESTYSSANDSIAIVAALNEKSRLASTLEDSAFAAHAVDSAYEGALAKPLIDLDHSAVRFRTAIQQGCANDGVNFGGHFTIVEWGCGTCCQQMAIVNRMNGKVYVPSLTYCGSAFRASSRLLIVNTEARQESARTSMQGALSPMQYVMTDGRLRRWEHRMSP